MSSMTDLTEQAKPTVMVRENLSAYYFSFETTGNQDIDRILGAIAWAGKAYHHTEDWDDDDLGLSCVDNIQNAANLAAATLETLTQENARLRFNKREWAEHFALHLNPDRDLKGNPLYVGDPAWSLAEAAIRFANSPARKALGGGDES